MGKLRFFLVFADKNDSYIADELQKEFFGSIVFCAKLTDDSTLYTWSEMNQHPEFMGDIPVPFCIDKNIAYFDPTGKAVEEGNQIVTEINYCINELSKIPSGIPKSLAKTAIEFTDIIYACTKDGHRDILAKTLRNATELSEQVPEYTIDPSSESSIKKGIEEIKGIPKEEVYIKKSDVIKILGNTKNIRQAELLIDQLPEYISENEEKEELEDEYDRD